MDASKPFNLSYLFWLLMYAVLFVSTFTVNLPHLRRRICKFAKSNGLWVMPLIFSPSFRRKYIFYLCIATFFVLRKGTRRCIGGCRKRMWSQRATIPNPTFKVKALTRRKKRIWKGRFLTEGLKIAFTFGNYHSPVLCWKDISNWSDISCGRKPSRKVCTDLSMVPV